jgi:uncharacterized protein (TIGR00369 family)
MLDTVPGMEGEKQTGADLAREWIRNSPFAQRVGLRLESLEPDEATLALDYDESLTTLGDVVHGGVITTLIDTAAAAAAWSTPDGSVPTAATTVGLTVEFLSAAHGADLRVRSRVVKRGRSLCFIDAEVTGPDGDLVAKGIVTYKVG